MPRNRHRTITIRLCSADRAIAAFLWSMLAGLASWGLYETHENSKQIAALVQRMNDSERSSDNGEHRTRK